MSRLVLCLTAFLFAISGTQAQSKKELSDMLSRDLQDYRRFTLALNLDSSLLYMPQKMFEIIPLDSLKATMIQAMDNQYISVKMTGLEFESNKKPEIKEAGAYFWAFVPFSGSMKLTIKGDKEFRKILIPVMKGQFGADGVQMEGDSIMNIMLKNKELIAFKTPNSPKWSLIEDKRSENGREGKQQKELFKAIMPPEVLNAIDKKN